MSGPAGIDPQFRPLSQFDTTGDGLKRGVSQLEQNVRNSIDRIAVQALPKLTATEKKTAAYTAVLDDLVVVAGTFPVTFPVASAQNAGRRIGVEVQSGAATVVPTTGLIQGATSDVLSTAGRYEYESDGVGWWRAPSGGGAGTLTDFTKDLGAARRSGTFDITGLSGLTTGKNVLIVQTAQPIASKGNARDEFEMDPIHLTGYVLSATSIRAYWNADNVVVGTYAFAYQVAA